MAPTCNLSTQGRTERSDVQGHLQLQREFKASLNYLRSPNRMDEVNERKGEREKGRDWPCRRHRRELVCVCLYFVVLWHSYLHARVSWRYFSLSAGISYSKQGQGRRHCSVRQPRVTRWHLALFIHRLPGHFLETPYQEVLLNSRSLQSTAAGDAPRCAL